MALRDEWLKSKAEGTPLAKGHWVALGDEAGTWVWVREVPVPLLRVVGARGE